LSPEQLPHIICGPAAQDEAQLRGKLPHARADVALAAGFGLLVLVPDLQLLLFDGSHAAIMPES